MAYVSNQRGMKVIDFQRVQLVGPGYLGDLPYIAPEMPAATEHPYVVLSVCDLQRHLIAAGKRIAADGTWGTASKTAFSDWTKTLPLADARTVMPTGYNALPTFGSREDYKFQGQSLRIPAIYATRLLPMANVLCRASVRTAPGEEPIRSDADVASVASYESKTPWAMIGVGVGAAVIIGVLVFKSKQKAGRA